MRNHRKLIFAVLVSLAVAGSLLATPAGQAAQGPAGTSSKSFYDKTKKLRADAIEQARCSDGRCPVRSASSKPQYATDHIVAGFTSASAIAPAAHRAGALATRRVGRTNNAIVRVPRRVSVRSFIARLRKDPSVRYAEPDYKVKTFSGTQTQSWGVRAIKAPQAISTNGVTGAGVTVAVIDTGVDYTHPDLIDNIHINAAEDINFDGRFTKADEDGIDNDGNGYVDDVVGYDFIGKFYTSTEPDNDPMDVYGHGTHVAGIVAAEDNSFGVVGVAPSAKIMPVRVLDDVGAGFDSTIANGIYYAVDNGAQIINMSLGGYGRSTILRQAIEYAGAHNVTVVAAAGNSFFYSLPSFPAAFPSVISVGAARDVDPASDTEPLEKVWWSDWGHTDFLAPGVNIRSTTPDNTYSTFSGTSMASPHVAGALALLYQAMVNHGLVPSPAKLEQLLGGSASDVYFAGKDEVSGAGVPDALAATTINASTHRTQLYRDAYLIPSDGTTPSTLTVRITDGNGAPVVGETGAWSTTKGTLTNANFTTDANGEAQTALTVDDDYGVATVTATPATENPASVRVIVEDDRIRVDNAYVMTEPQGFPGPFEDPFAPLPTPGVPDGGVTEIAPQPGEDVVFKVFLGNHQSSFDAHTVNVDWTVTDPGSAPVPDLSGSLDPVSVLGFGDTGQFTSEAMMVPFDATPGRYHLSVTATTDTGETSTFDKDFYIGNSNAEVLVVSPALSFDLESLNYFLPHDNDSAVRRAVESTGRSFTYWDQGIQGPPPADVLLAHPVVIWLGGFFGEDLDLDAISQYIASGGNLIVSGEHYASIARLNSTTASGYKSLFGASGLLTTFFPDDNNEQNPSSVTLSSTSYAPLATLAGTYNLGSYDLNHTNESTALFTDELKLSATTPAETLAAYPRGVNASGGFEAGTVNDDGFSRVVDLGFGLESIDDSGSVMPLSGVVSTLLNFFEPSPAVFSVTPTKVKQGGTVFINGEGFQGLGGTTVTIGGRVMKRAVVLDHGTIAVKIPRTFRPGVYDVAVTTPNGQTATLLAALTVKKL